jgi:ribosome-associated protein
MRINAGLDIPEGELSESFIRADGPGGQNVNKVSSAVQLRFNAAASLSLPEPVRFRLMTAAGGKITDDGVIVITAKRFRDQTRNREDARNRLAEMIRAACIEPKKRRQTKPSRAAKEKRVDDKKVRARTKQNRNWRGEE